MQHLRVILSPVLTNSETRKLFSNFSLIRQDLLARDASKATDGLRPASEALTKVEEYTPAG